MFKNKTDTITALQWDTRLPSRRGSEQNLEVFLGFFYLKCFSKIPEKQKEIFELVL